MFVRYGLSYKAAERKGDAKMMKYKRCRWCKKYFEPYSKRQLFCSVECREKDRREEVKQRHPKKPLPGTKPTLSIKEVVRLAMEEHMTYGKYVEKYGLK